MCVFSPPARIGQGMYTVTPLSVEGKQRNACASVRAHRKSSPNRGRRHGQPLDRNTMDGSGRPDPAGNPALLAVACPTGLAKGSEDHSERTLVSGGVRTLKQPRVASIAVTFGTGHGGGARTCPRMEAPIPTEGDPPESDHPRRAHGAWQGKRTRLSAPTLRRAIISKGADAKEPARSSCV